MKPNALIALLLIVAIGLGIGLYVRHQKAETRYREYEASIQQLSNQWNQTSAKLVEQQKVNVILETNYVVRTVEAEGLTNKLLAISNQLTQTEIAMKAAAKAAEEEIARRETKIKELENQNDGLSKSMDDLKGNITSLEAKIAETEQKLATTQGEKEFLIKELKRLQAEKAELVRQFNDLAVLREQVRHLKEELSISRRLDWIRRGLYGDVKGAQRLQEGFKTAPPKTNYNLDIELKRDGASSIKSPANQTVPPIPPAPQK